MNVPKEFEEALRQLDLAARELGIQYALIGGVAVILQGHARATRDIDVSAWDIDERLEDFADALGRRGIKPRIENWLAFTRQNRVLLVRSNSGIDIDIALAFFPFEREMIESAENFDVAEGARIKVAKPEDLIALKVFAGRDRDMEDARRLFELHPNLDRNHVLKIVADLAETMEQTEIMDRLNQVFGSVS